MAGIYRDNIKAIIESEPFNLPIIQAYEDRNDLSDLVQKDGEYYFLYEDKYYKLHSKNKERETGYLTKSIDFYKDLLLILFGMGNTTLLKKVFEETSPDTKIIVLEPNPAVFYHVMHHTSINKWIDSGKMVFICGQEREINWSLSYVLSHGWENLIRNIAIVSLPNYYLYNEYKIKCVSLITKRLDGILKTMGNSLEDTLVGLHQFYHNVDACMRTNSLKEVKGQYKGYPAIVVASGPSLDKNIAYLKEAEGKALIIACDASYPACIKAGVIPDAIASIERDEPTYTYYYKDKEFHEKVVLIGPGLMWPEIYTSFKGKMILQLKGNAGLEEWWGKHFENMEFYPSGHSCANVAYGFAVEAGCEPIILIGQDLAFTDDKIHSKLTHTELEGENKMKDNEEEVWVEDIYGGKVRTDMYYNVFRYYFETRILSTGIKTIDATEGGAKIQGAEIMDFKDAIQQYCKQEIGNMLYDRLSDVMINDKMRYKKYNELIRDSEVIMQRLKTAREKAIKHYENIKEYENFDYEHATEKQLIDVVKKMQPGNNILTYIKDSKNELITFYQSIIKHAVIAVKEIGNELTPDTVKKNWDIQVNLMYMIEVASLATAKEYGNLIEYLNEKISHLKEHGYDN